MLSISGRTSGLSSAVRAVTQCCGGRQIPQTPAVPLLSHWEERDHTLPDLLPYDYQTIPIELDVVPPPRPQTSHRLSRTLVLFTRNLLVGTGIGVVQQFRYLHNDIKIPNFNDYRRQSTKDAGKLSKETRDLRRLPTDLVKIGAGVMGVIAAKKVVHTLVSNLSPAPSSLALGVIEVDLSSIEEGNNVTIKWNNKPVFVRHRTAEEIARERAVDPKELRDPQTDEERSVTGKWLVVMGICTHLGCVPISHKEGYSCPCHGSHYDAAGRIRKGPAPLNLEVPDHHIIEEENKLILGVKAPDLSTLSFNV